MKTEKDIRKFIQDNRISVPKDDSFMKELVRQMELLPTPASLSGNDEEKIQENLRILSLIRQALKKRHRRQAVKTLILNAVLCVIIFAGVYLFVDPIWKYIILGVSGLVTLAFSLSRNGLFNV